jgi:hypothetical protein
MNTDLHSIGQAYLAAGLCVVPAGQDKRPKLPSWTLYQKQLPIADELDEWFHEDRPHGLGLVCGKISGGLEVLDLDAKHDPSGTLNARAEAAIKEFAPGLWERLPRETTPSAGLHLYFRSAKPAGNMKLAMPAVGTKAVAETRGEGGFIVSAPTPGYIMVNGSLTEIPTITDDERDSLLAAARSLDESEPKIVRAPSTMKGAELSPLDDYNLRGDALDLLRQHGWHVGAGGKLRRPGKDHGCSATWNHAGKGKLCVFSSSTPFDMAPSTYSPAGIYTVLECGGDFSRAAAELRRLGYGADRPITPATVSTEIATAKPTDAPHSVPLASLAPPDESTRAESNLLGNGFLRRGQTGLINGATGIGKSSLTTQAGVEWSVGRSALGIKPQQALRVLIVQSENDDSDVAEMRDGILSGLQLSDAELSLYKENVRIMRSFKSGAKWLAEITADVVEHRPDLIIVDPLFAFAGVDLAKDQPGLSAFLREMLLPFTIKYRLGVLLVHHTNKPPASKGNASTYAAGDHAYSGSGHNELPNFVRFVVVLRSLGSSTVFEFRIGKRWKRAGMTDESGTLVDRRLIKHADTGLFWEPATEQDLAATLDRPGNSPSSQKMLDEAAAIADAFFAIQKRGQVSLEALSKRTKKSEKTLRRRFGIGRGLLRVGDDVLAIRDSIVYVVTDAESMEVAA